MLIRKAYKFRLKTDDKLEQTLAQMAGCCRFVWNMALAMNVKRLEDKQSLLWYHELAFWLTFWKKTEELSFLKSCPSQSLQQVLMNLARAFKDAFDKTQSNKRLPRYKKRYRGDSFCCPQGFKLENRRVFLPKIGWVGFYKSRELEGTPKNITIKKLVDGWYVCVQVEIEVAESKHPSKTTVGVDLGVVRFATLSTGEFFKPLNSFRNYEKLLAKAQRRLSRQQKFSNNWKRQKRKIGKIHLKIRNRRLDRLHWISSTVSKNHAVIVLEDLRIKNMSKSSKGSLEMPGKNVKVKSGLNKSIVDQGWGIFRDLLQYKQNWLGGEIILVDPKYTSQKCPKCLNIDSKNRLTQSNFQCISCSYKENADLTGAKNVLAAGLAVMACQANSNKSRQQEPVGIRKVVLS